MEKEILLDRLSVTSTWNIIPPTYQFILFLIQHSKPQLVVKTFAMKNTKMQEIATGMILKSLVLGFMSYVLPELRIDSESRFEMGMSIFLF